MHPGFLQIRAARRIFSVYFPTSPKCGTLTWWGGLSGLIKY